jgi:hypothetical protein
MHVFGEFKYSMTAAVLVGGAGHHIRLAHRWFDVAYKGCGVAHWDQA